MPNIVLLRMRLALLVLLFVSVGCNDDSSNGDKGNEEDTVSEDTVSNDAADSATAEVAVAAETSGDDTNGFEADSGTSGVADTDTPVSDVADTQTAAADTADNHPDTAGDTETGPETDTETVADVTTDPDISDDLNPPETAEYQKRKLLPVQDCARAETLLKDRIMNKMVTEVEKNREAVLNARQMPEEDCYSDMIGWGGGYAGTPDPTTELDGGDAGESAGEYSTTNNQVDGVDEADFVKNDSGYIYILADGAFQIVDAWPADEATIVSRTLIEGEPKKLFVHGDKAVVYSSLGAVSTSDNNFSAVNSGADECTHGYDCDFVGDGKELKITVLDISNMSEPQVIRETRMNGSYLNARRIDDAVYTVVIFPELLSGIELISYYPNDVYSWYCGMEITETDDEINAAFDALIESNRAIIEALDMVDVLPQITDQVLVDGERVSTQTLGDDCSHFYINQTGDGNNVISVLGLDLASMSDYTLSSVISRPGAVYADNDSLYLAMRHYPQYMGFWFFPASSNTTEATTVHRFNLTSDTATASYQGSGVVKGRILNQFAMDEYEGHLRIATTTGRVPSPDVHSTMSVLAVDTQGDLLITGQIDDIAPTEDIRSARFSGDRGFIVTFKKTDPLFVFDLSDPANPQITGELKIPGYATYMHIMDDEHILSIGFDAEDHDTFAYFQGIQLQVLDITDVGNPQLLHKEVIGTRGSTSDAATDHLAFNYFKSFDQLAIPMVICEQSAGGGSYGDYMSFSGLLVYNVTVADGFTELGRIPHGEPESESEPSGMCNNWWTDGNSQVKRSIFMDDYVYSIAPELINISNIADLENPVSSVSLEI